MSLKIYDKNYKITYVILVVLIFLSFLFIYTLLDRIASAEPDWNRINKVQECQRDYNNCTSYCQDNECLNKCDNALRNCLNY